MPLPDKQPPTATQVARHVERALAERIPPGWSLCARTEAPTGRYQVDLLAEIASPVGATAVLAVEIKRTLEPRGVLQAVEQISAITNRALPRAVPVVAASLPSPRAPVPSFVTAASATSTLRAMFVSKLRRRDCSFLPTGSIAILGRGITSSNRCGAGVLHVP